jgi:hypothetical protein
MGARAEHNRLHGALKAVVTTPPIGSWAVQLLTAVVTHDQSEAMVLALVALIPTTGRARRTRLDGA